MTRLSFDNGRCGSDGSLPPPPQQQPANRTVAGPWNTRSCIPTQVACISPNRCFVLARGEKRVFCSASAEEGGTEIPPGQTALIETVPLSDRAFEAFAESSLGGYTLSVPGNAKSCDLKLATNGSRVAASLDCEFDAAATVVATYVVDFVSTGSDDFVVRKADKQEEEQSKPDKNPIDSATTARQGDQQQQKQQ